MFVEKRKSGKNIKYYLVHSFRQAKKVKKIRRYLGKNLSKKQIEEKSKMVEKQIQHRIKVIQRINDPLLEALSEEEIKKLKQLFDNKEFKVFHLSEEQWEKFSELFTYNTNAIEGSELSKKEVKEILRNDKWPQNKTKEDISEAYGVKEAINHIRKIKETLSIRLIKKIHHIIFKNSKPYAGKLREKGTEVVVRNSLGNIIHEGAPSEKLQDLLKELIEWYEKYKNKYPPILLSAVVHNQFENIHPFQDGNGRVGRILMNNILIKHDLPPVNIELRRRKRYYQTLEEYQKNHDIKPTIELMLDEYKTLKKQLR